MNTMKWDERVIATAIGRQVLNKQCLLLVDRCTWTGAECDVLAVTRNLRIIDVEIKISRADLKADAHKEKWWDRGMGSFQGGKWVRPDPVARLWPRSIWKHYYAMPEEIWKDDLLTVIPSPSSGVILLKPGHQLPALARVLRRAKPNANAKPIGAEAVLDIARLANLRMWDAYEQIERMADENRECVVP